MIVTIELYDLNVQETLMQHCINTGNDPEVVLNAALTMYFDTLNLLDNIDDTDRSLPYAE